MQADIGLIGLAVMGENLVMNMESKGFAAAVFNRSTDKVRRFVEGRGKGRRILGCYSLPELVESLKRPRKIMLMIKAGQAVDEMLEQLLPMLEPGDILIDGGNSYFEDTRRRMKYVNEKGLLYLGMGVSGGEEGALHGPCLMPGGNREAWDAVKELFQAVSAKAEEVPCCSWIGSDGAGHFVKMVHNGIEYGDMQLICEVYQLMRDGLGMSCEEMHRIFACWNETELDSYLVEITRDILGYQDEKGERTVEKILDTAGQKGTGKWTSQAALQEGVPLTLISEAVFARCTAAAREERVKAHALYKRTTVPVKENKDDFVEDLRKALYASKIISYAQGYGLLRKAAKTYGWELDYGGIALSWRGGCIIRSVFLGKIKEAYDRDLDLSSLILDPYFKEALSDSQESWRRVVAAGALSGVPLPAMSAALAYFDSFTCDSLPANLLQAQRDYFGAHTYERTDRPRGTFFHTNWTGNSGSTQAGNYVV